MARRTNLEPAEPGTNLRHILRFDAAALTAGAVCLAVLGVRVWWSREPLFGAADLHRSILTGRAVLHHGLSAAGRPLSDYFPSLGRAVPWKENPFNYPPVPVGFFTGVAALGGGIFVSKLLLTLCDAISAVLIARTTHRRLLGVLFFASPVSMWWTSHEGQFDALQTMFGIAALATLGLPICSGVLLAVAIQTKVTSAALLPFVFWHMRTRGTTRRWLVGMAVGLLPTMLCSLVYPVVPNILRYSVQFRANPYALLPAVFKGMWPANPAFGLLLPQILSWVLLGWLVAYAWRTRAWARVAPALGFAVFMKLHPQIPGWYLTALPLVLLPLFMHVTNVPENAGEANPQGDGPVVAARTMSERALRMCWMAAVTLEVSTLATISFFYTQRPR